MKQVNNLMPKGKPKGKGGEIYHFDIVQGTWEWDEIRLGRITGSGVSALMSDPRSKKDKELGLLSDGAKSYILQKVSECQLGYSGDKIEIKQFEWGHKYEPEARDYYQIQEGVIAIEVGFVEYNKWIGISPDSLIGNDGGLEIKCPYKNQIHLKYLELKNQDDLMKVEKGYFYQIMMALWITGRSWWDFVSYDPRMTNSFRFHKVRVERDESVIKEIKFRCQRASGVIQEKLINYA